MLKCHLKCDTARWEGHHPPPPHIPNPSSSHSLHSLLGRESGIIGAAEQTRYEADSEGDRQTAMVIRGNQ